MLRTSVGEGVSRGTRRLRRLASSGVIVLLALMGWTAFGAIPAQASTIFVQESFTGSTTSSANWTVPSAPTGDTNIACLTASGATSGTPIPGCQTTALDASGSGALRLTNIGKTEEGGVAYGLSIPTTQGIDATFDTYQYGSGSEADGIAFFLAAVNPTDPAPVSAIGQPGGYLGYAGSGSDDGMVDGYLGLGLDVYGNYSNTTFDTSGCGTPTWMPAGDVGVRVQNEITVRGPGNGVTGYCMLNSTIATVGSVALQGSTTQTNDAARTAAEVPVEVVINPGSTSITTGSGLTVPAGDYEIAFTPIGGTLQTLPGELPTTGNGLLSSSLYPAGYINTTTGMPYQLDFGWVGSTGGSTDIHEVNNETAQSITTTSVPVFATSMSSSPPSVQQNDTLTYMADVSLASSASSGNAESEQIYVTDTFPINETPQSSGLGGSTNWSCSISGQTDTCTYTRAGYPAGTALDPLSLPVEVTAAGGTDVTDSFLVSSDDAASSSASDTITVAAPPGAATTTTTLTSLPDPTTTGASTTLTAHVTTTSGTPTGTIDFEDGGTSINGCAAVTLSSAQATCATTFLASAGSPASLTAVYSGSSSYAASTGTLSLIVNGATPTIGLTSSVNPSVSAQSTTLTATVSTTLTGVPSPTGTVEFEAKPSEGSYAAISGCTVVTMTSGVATCTTSFEASGSVYDLEAVYSGDGNYVSVTSPVLGQIVNKADQTITFTSSPPSADYGSTYTVSATGGGSTSPVVFTSGTTGICTVVSGGDLVTFVATGTCTIDANQAADSNYTAAPQVDQSFTVSKEATSFTASTSPTAAAHGNQVTLSASGLTSGATGTITFATGSTTWCTATVSAGAGSCTTSSASAVGSPTVTATYNGDTDHATSTASTSFSITTDPVLVVSTSGTPSDATQGTSYSLALSASTGSSGGPAYNDPTLTATLPAGGETFAAAPSAVGWSCGLNGGSTVLTCTSTLGSITAGTTLAPVTATVNIAPSATGSLETGASLADSADLATAATATATVDVTPDPDLDISSSGTPPDAAAGSSYTLTLSSSLGASGGPAYNGPTLAATLPSGETFAAAPNATGWSCSLSVGDTVLTCTSTLAPIAAGTVLPSVTVTVDTASKALGMLQTTASLADAADAASTATTTASVDATATPVLDLSTSGTPTTAPAGTVYTLNVDVALSPGGGPAYNEPTVAMVLPTGETFAAAPTVPGWDCVLSAGGTTLTCTRVAATPIEPGTELLSLSVQVQVSSGATGELITTVSAGDTVDGATLAVTAARVGIPVATPATGGMPRAASPWGLGVLLAIVGFPVILGAERRRRRFRAPDRSE